MKPIFITSMSFVGSLLALSLGSDGLVGQPSATRKTTTSTPLRTADGQPDLEGIWNFGTGTPLQRPPELAGKESLTPEEAARFEEQRAAASRNARARPGNVGSYNDFWNEARGPADWTKRTSLITDPPNGQLPPMTSEAAKREAERAAAAANPGGPEDFAMADRCIRGFNAGPPMLPGPYNNNVQLFQTRDVVVIYNEMVHKARIVLLDGRPPVRSTIRLYSGDSRGRWDGDTLVVETTNFREGGQLWINRQVGPLLHRTATDENLHLIERFTRTAPNTLLYEFTVNDLTTWTQPWSAALTMNKTDERIYEYACHEGNYAVANTLAGARAQEKAAGAATRP
jgi:hypothetical protein